VPRPTCPRKVGFFSNVNYFKPAWTPIGILEEVVIGHDEVEAIRLKNLVGLSQEKAASQMGVSQPTFHRLLLSAHQKMTEAIVSGAALRIEGGNVTAADISTDSLPVEEGMGLSSEANTRNTKEGNQRGRIENENSYHKRGWHIRRKAG